MKPFDFNRCRELARQAAAEGCVLLKNDNQVLPVKQGSRIAVFGRIQLHYYKSGAGSGGMVNTDYVVSILDGLKNAEEIQIDENLLQIYQDWVEAHPFDYGKGWAQEPRCQEEMPLSDEVAKQASERNDMAVVVLGRLAGEDFDHTKTAGSYYLTGTELSMLCTVRRNFGSMAVVLNTGNIIDLNWADEIRPDALLLAWQAGQEGGNGTADILTGKVNPSGRLCDTIAYEIKDYPADANFGGETKNDYQEDIYLGYRYFETFAQEKVRYPFGYGMSYTDFAFETRMEFFSASESERSAKSADDLRTVALYVTVKNTGNSAGREVVQIYAKQPVGKLGKPDSVLVDFGKTGCLKPGESQTLTFTVNPYTYASYDDGGKTGHPFCYVLEAGEYCFYAGKNVRDKVLIGSLVLSDTIVVEQCRQVLAPAASFERRNGEGFEPVPLRQYSLKGRIAAELPETEAYTGDRGYRLRDVLEGAVSMETFLAQLTDEDLACMVRGEGMSSPKVTAGTGGAFGGVTERLLRFGIPVLCCTDGPSGIRMDSGAKAFSHPCGTLLACTFDKKLNEDLFEMAGAEMAKMRIEVLLGPGMNLHRHPLNGRNFEYFSEDPVLSGQIGAAQLRGLHRQHVTGCIKHFCANNQEFHRHTVSSNISERALRELYLKGYEVAVKEGAADCIMTTYGAVNGIWTAGNYDLCTSILRKEWGFSGIVMTDWWANINEEGGVPGKENGAFMVRAQNDLYMVCESAERNTNGDNILEKLSEGVITRGQLVRNAGNICRFAMRSLAMERMLHPEQYEREAAEASAETGFFAGDVEFIWIEDGTVIDLSGVCTEKGNEKLLAVRAEKMCRYRYTITASSDASPLAQIPITIFSGGIVMGTCVLHGTEGRTVSFTGNVDLNGANTFIRIRFGQSGAKLKQMVFHSAV